MDASLDKQLKFQEFVKCGREAVGENRLIEPNRAHNPKVVSSNLAPATI